MKITSFMHQGRHSYGIVEGNQIIDLDSMKAIIGNDVKEAIERNRLLELREIDLNGLPRIDIADVTFLPVISNPGKILCIGINYATHVRETGRDMPTYPMIFTRFADSQTAHMQPILRPAASHKLDFEGELAVVIGKTARHVDQADALDYVAGYSCYNDGSVRDWQKHTIQFVPGKNFPQTGSFGPWLVTSDEIENPQDLELTTRLNGEVMQHTNTSDMIFEVRKLIEYCTTFTELAPGDVIVTGTTGGVGAFREPPVWMKPGDIVEVEISSIGILRNIIADEK
ncbi:fumarylacetoacetate hydrolase family protein [Pseudomonas mohnii]|jgi:2-keto-4-pentenoate hydratase/2-oxohepta-3-ene-1,7-dioic acid hydratase in catechol pathway|uniref:fumarylacetoacetate hydrolase family protein n=1 Tax=Pseudomonas TaxID=286 RepID=UPI001029D923|nr:MULTISPECIES: fumarylacetoacetate hydrolase family protein [Pseudomonas]MBH8609881.1 fumarylacetoacetate hydrolase family protein [Pseudomonas mohnii]MBM6443862.1 fumarylacetoacetate hydrolase family protein [Pseudomonas sp. MIL9]RZO06860.1 FAA hydrolase family protein [Pseudomonas moorei]